MKPDKIAEKIIVIFLHTFKDLKKKTFTLDKNRNSFESWDSLTHMQLVSEVETQFKINFEMDEIVDVNTPNDFVKLIQKKLNATK